MSKAINKKLYKGAIIAALSASVLFGSLAATGDMVFTAAEEGATPVQSNYTITNKVEGKTYYVAPDVARGEGEGTEASPYNIYTLLTGSTLQPGDTVIVKNGEYEVNAAMKLTASGSTDGYITVRKEDAEGDAVLKFYDMVFLSTNRGVEIVGDYWHWIDVDICGAGDNGMYIGGSYNVVENSEFYDNRDTGLQLGRSLSEYNNINDWPSYNLIKNCTSYNNYDNETYGENADGFAAKLTIGYGNIFDGCIAYRNSDDGWDLYAKADSGNIGAVIMYNCVAFENGFLMESQAEFNAKFPNYDTGYNEPDTSSYYTRDGDGNGFKLGGSVMEGDVFMYNCLAFSNRMHGVTDNSNPGVLNIKNVTAYNNSAIVDANGQVVMSGVTADSCNNIDMSRQDYSYNILSNVLSVNKDSTHLGSDAYRGAAEYSLFDNAAGKAYKIEEWVDASDVSEPYAQKGTQVDAVTADVFEQLPVTWTLTDGVYSNYVYNLSGKGNHDVHETYRNADNSINMGTMLNIKDTAYAGMFGDEHKIGSDLNGTSWDDYIHPDYVNASNCDGAADAAVTSAHATLYVNTSTEATFQDFDLTTVMEDVTITWTTSDKNVIDIDTDTTVSYSGAHDARAIVYRGAEDKQVTLTATITSTEDKTVSMKREFVITVKADVPTIGDVIIDGMDGDSLIFDQFTDATEPEIYVSNAADYNGKLLDESLYEIESVYKYAETKSDNSVEVHHFTTGVAGVYVVEKTIKLGEQKTTFTYTIYVASSFADVDFASTPTINVNKDGYIISGEMNSPTGILYSYASAQPVENITAEEVVSKGTAYEFRSDSIAAQFENANSGAYNVYYVLTNLYGDVTSEVYSTAVQTVEIGTAAQLKEVLLNNDSSKIYILTADIDFAADLSWLPEETAQQITAGTAEITGNLWLEQISGKKVPFKGLLNGNGHTIKNITVASDDNEKAAVIYKLAGGTVENVKFENITITGNSQKAGIFAISEGGYIYNVAMKNVRVHGAQRVGALIGQVALNTTYIDQVSLTNDRTYTLAEGVTENDFAKMTYYTLADGVYTKATGYVEGTTYYTLDADITGDRIGAIVGFIQSSSASNYSKTYISNVYVNAVIGTATSQYVGSVVGRYDDRNANDYLEIKTAYSNAMLRCTKYQGGIIGGQSGAGVLRISMAMFNGNLYYAADLANEIFTALKNCSGIMGYYSANADTEITMCYAKLIEYNSDYDVDTDALVLGNAKQIKFWESNMGVTEDRWTLVVNDEGTRVQDPYVTLNFLES